MNDAPISPTLIPATPLLGRKAGSFTLLRELGRGGMGTVYLGEHEVIGSRVAVKVLHPHLSADPSLVQRFFAEAKAVNLVGHENIVRIYDMSRMESGEWYLVMEYLAGQPLSLFAQKPLAERTACGLLAQLCDALEAAHARGIVHRDVKPENVFVLPRADGSLTAKLLDFGIARFFGDIAAARTQAGCVVGTPSFMAPEQWDQAAVDGRTDVYAVGVLGYWLVTGTHPFGELPLTDLVLAQKEGRFAEPSKQISSALRQVLTKAMAPEMNQRFASAAELKNALRGILDAPAPAPRPLSTKDLVRYKAQLTVDQRSRPVEVTDLSRAGAYVCCDDPPPMRASITLTLSLPSGQLSCRGEVVRQVPAELAQSWNLPPGFAVQFERMLQSSVGKPGAGANPNGALEDKFAARRLRELACRMTGDHYVLLDASPQAPLSELRRRGQALLDELAELAKSPLATDTRHRLRRLTEQVHQAVWTLRDPARRAAYDAEHGNLPGIAQCLADGLSHAELERLRHAWVADHSRNVQRAELHRLTGSLHLARREHEAALGEYEKALALDPLNLDLHRAVATLCRTTGTERSA